MKKEEEEKRKVGQVELNRKEEERSILGKNKERTKKTKKTNWKR